MKRIKTLEVRGLRGIKRRLPLDLDGRSILIYGDNGSGKSSISDAIEWFYRGRIEHLSSEEIGRNGIPALRSILLDDADQGAITIEYTEGNTDSSRTICLRKGSFESTHSNVTDDFRNFLDLSNNENLILRYRDLVPFIIAHKKDRLDHLSGIIGFSRVSEVRAVLKQTVNDLARGLKLSDFDNQISNQQQHMIEYFGHNVTTKRQFIDAVNNLMKPLGLPRKLSSLDEREIRAITRLVAKPEDAETIELQGFYRRARDTISNMNGPLATIRRDYAKYVRSFEALARDLEKISKIILDRLLREGVTLLESGAFKQDKCPLCLQPKKRSDLIEELEARIQELQHAKTEKLQLDEARSSLQDAIKKCKETAGWLLLDSHVKLAENKKLMIGIETLNKHLETYLAQLNIDIASAEKPKPVSEIAPKPRQLNSIMKFCKEKGDALKSIAEGDKRLEIHSKMLLAIQAYQQIERLKRAKQRWVSQLSSMESIYDAFVKKQSEALTNFLDQFSTDINELYEFMNPDENVGKVRLVPVQRDDELVGITMDVVFHGSLVSPPHGYLSESHLNCLGIAFFLTSAMAFNKENRFLVLDDVISSFDSGHRKRFADLINERFSDYQIILLTHEKAWFDYMHNMVKAKNWHVRTVKWDPDNGTHIDESLETLEERIERRIKGKDCDGLGNDMRRYLERVLKQVAFDLEVKVKFLYNDANEDRMCYELLTELKGKINKHAGQEMRDDQTLARLIASSFIGSKASHDSSFDPTIGDLTAFWRDIRQLERMLCCDEESCEHKSVSLKYYDNVKKTANCGCGKLSYSWKK